MAAITQFPAEYGVDADFTKQPQRRPFKNVIRLPTWLSIYCALDSMQFKKNKERTKKKKEKRKEFSINCDGHDDELAA